MARLQPDACACAGHASWHAKVGAMQTIARLMVLTVTVLALVGCSGDDPPSSSGRSTGTSASTTVPSVEAVGSDGCGKSPLGPGLHELSVDVGDHDYPYRVHVPAGLKPDGPAPVVVGFHGFTQPQDN